MFTKTHIAQVVDSQHERLGMVSPGMPRPVSGYEKLTTHAFILTGIRRCGKSTILQQLYREIGKPAIFLNFEDPRLAGFDLSDFNRLHEIALERMVEAYFLDEIQLVPLWQGFVRFRLDESYRIFITGSNASLLSDDLGIKLTGRHIGKILFPFSYNEFLSFTGEPAGEASVRNYLTQGGFPEFLKTGSADVLMQIFNDIVARDVALRHGIRNTGTLRQLAVWLASHVAKTFTANSVRKLFQIASASSVMEYLTYFEDAYLFFFLQKFSYSEKVRQVNPRKVYCVDNGLVYHNSLSFSDDWGRLLENQVYLHLRHTSDEIYYFSESHECDFVVFNHRKSPMAIQVCWKVTPENMTREMDGLRDAMEFFDLTEGTIVTLDQRDLFEKDGKTIHLVPFLEFSRLPVG